MIRRLFVQSLGLSLFGLTFPIGDSRATKYLDKNLIIVSESEMESIRKKTGLLFIPRCSMDSGSNLLSEMKEFVWKCKHYNTPITKNVYGNLNKKGFSIISYDEPQNNTWSILMPHKPPVIGTTIVWKSRRV